MHTQTTTDTRFIHMKLWFSLHFYFFLFISILCDKKTLQISRRRQSSITSFIFLFYFCCCCCCYSAYLALMCARCVRLCEKTLGNREQCIIRDAVIQCKRIRIKTPHREQRRMNEWGKKKNTKKKETQYFYLYIVYIIYRATCHYLIKKYECKRCTATKHLIRYHLHVHKNMEVCMTMKMYYINYEHG